MSDETIPPQWGAEARNVNRGGSVVKTQATPVGGVQ